MNSLVLQTASRFLLPLLLLLSVVILLRGHNTPGGGFVGGLLAASAFALQAMAFDVESARRMLRVNLLAMVGLGLTLALVSGFFSLAAGGPLLKGLWFEAPVLGFDDPIKLGTPVLFDIGVYLTVLGVVLTMIFTLQEVVE